MTMFKIFFALAAAAFLPFVVSRSLTSTEEEGDTEIFNGSPAAAGEFPSFALLCYNGDTTCGGCGGVLITSRHVLTAAHCVDSNTDVVTGVRIGAALTLSDGEYFPVTNIAIHPDFLYTQAVPTNDVAVLTLSGEVASTCGRPASFNRDAAKTNVDGQELTAIGYGGYDAPNTPSTYLRKTTVVSYNDISCGAAAQNKGYYYNSETMLCTKSSTLTCKGDSGGPLFDSSGTVWGLVSWGEACGTDFPDYFTEVATFQDWIDEQAPCSSSFRWECGTAALRKVMKWFGYLGDDSS